MNKIEKLIDELCPLGVKYFKLNEIAEFSNNGIDKKIKENEVEVGLLNFKDVFRLSKIKSKDISATTSVPNDKKENALIKKNDIYITPSSEVKDEIGMSSVVAEDIPNTVYSYHIARIRIKDFDQVNPYFLSYLFYSSSIRNQINENSQGMTRYGLTKPKWENLRFPVPPLKIQNEIVNILDTFTELEAELQAELESRRKQLIHYSEELCTKNGDRYYEKKQLGEIATLIRGRRFVKDDIKDSGVPAIHYGEIYTKYNIKAYKAISYLDAEQARKLRKARPGDIVMVAAGETIEDIGKSVAWLGEEDIVIHDACIGISSEQVDPEFLAFYFDTFEFRSQLNERITSSKISAISPDKLWTTLVPLPKLVEQKDISQKISAIFDLIHNYIPDEILARRKQYEYYRERLLTFQELESA